MTRVRARVRVKARVRVRARVMVVRLRQPESSGYFPVFGSCARA